jgi:F0F1-type ATP synthase assembly protein I
MKKILFLGLTLTIVAALAFVGDSGESGAGAHIPLLVTWLPNFLIK